MFYFNEFGFLKNFTFSEAIDPLTGKVVSRHWFSWPGAFISKVMLLSKRMNMDQFPKDNDEM